MHISRSHGCRELLLHREDQHLCTKVPSGVMRRVRRCCRQPAILSTAACATAALRCPPRSHGVTLLQAHHCQHRHGSAPKGDAAQAIIMYTQLVTTPAVDIDAYIRTLCRASLIVDSDSYTRTLRSTSLIVDSDAYIRTLDSASNS